VPVSTEASTTRGRRLLDRLPMPPYVRTTIQISVAGTLALAAYAELVATAAPLRRATFGHRSSQLTEVLPVSSAARQYAHSLPHW
jgi:hypothetical protein